MFTGRPSVIVGNIALNEKYRMSNLPSRRLWNDVMTPLGSSWIGTKRLRGKEPTF